MAKKSKKKDAPAPVSDVDALLAQMREDGLSIQTGGYTVEAIPTGISSFDHSTGIGGIPRRRVVTFQGEEGSGKTLLLLYLIASVQRAGGRAAFIDLEHALTPSFARLLGVDYDSLIISRPRTLNEAYDVARPLCSSGLFDVVGFDSAVALATIDEIDKKAVAGSQRASVAQVHSDELRKLVSSIHDRTAFVIINQLRENPNPPSWFKGGKQLYAPGGRALKHYSSMIVDVSMGQPYKEGHMRVGHLTKTYIRKNKVAQPFTRSEFPLMYQTGVDLITDMVDAAIKMGVIVVRGTSWFNYTYVDTGTGEEITAKWSGRDTMMAAIREDLNLRNLIAADVAEAKSSTDESAFGDKGYDIAEEDDG